MNKPKLDINWENIDLTSIIGKMHDPLHSRSYLYATLAMPDPFMVLATVLLNGLLLSGFFNCASRAYSWMPHMGQRIRKEVIK